MIPTSAILNLCELYDASVQEFERIMKLEKVMYPILTEESKETK